jgi:hypothetical protein
LSLSITDSLRRTSRWTNIEEAAGTSYNIRNSLSLAFCTGCIIIVGCRKIKEKYHGHSDTNNILYVVYDSERSIADSLIAALYLCRRLGLPNTQQIVLHLQRNLQRADILVHRTIQAIAHCVYSYSLHSFVDRRIDIEETTVQYEVRIFLGETLNYEG